MQVTTHGGVAEIGGNCIEVEHGGTRLLLDFGVPFGRFGDAYGGFLQPRKVAGLGDWLDAGVAPDLPGLYRQDYRRQMGAREEERRFDAVLVSHPHMDHMGLLPLLRPDIVVGGSPTAFAVAKAIERTGGSFGESDFTRFREQFRLRPSTKKGETDRLVRVKYSDDGERGEEPAPRPWRTTDRIELGGITAHMLPVDHSIHGARGVLLEGDVQLAYSGDLRMHGRHREWTERWAARCAGVDVLLVEGTNIHNEKHVHRSGNPDGPGGHLGAFRAFGEYSESGVEAHLAEQLAHEPGFIFAAYPQRDLDRLETFLRLARRLGRKLCLTPKQAELLCTVDAHASAALDAPVPTLDDPDLRIYVPRKRWGLIERDDLRATQWDLVAQDYDGWERPYLTHPKTVHRRDIAADPGKYIVFADVWNLTELHEFKPAGGVYVSSKTEPFDEEMELDRARLLRWLARWNLREVGAHVSGHAPPQDLQWLAAEVGARRIVPIHTEHPEAAVSLFGSRAVLPTLGGTLAF